MILLYSQMEIFSSRQKALLLTDGKEQSMRQPRMIYALTFQTLYMQAMVKVSIVSTMQLSRLTDRDHILAG